MPHGSGRVGSGWVTVIRPDPRKRSDPRETLIKKACPETRDTKRTAYKTEHLVTATLIFLYFSYNG